MVDVGDRSSVPRQDGRKESSLGLLARRGIPKKEQCPVQPQGAPAMGLQRRYLQLLMYAQ